MQKVIINLEEKIELKCTLKQLDDDHRNDLETLNQQIMLYKEIEDALDTQDEHLPCPINEDHLRHELHKCRQSIEELQRTLDENELIRAAFEERVRINHHDKARLEAEIYNQEDIRDSTIRQLQREVEIMRVKLIEKDEIIERLRDDTT